MFAWVMMSLTIMGTSLGPKGMALIGNIYILWGDKEQQESLNAYPGSSFPCSHRENPLPFLGPNNPKMYCTRMHEMMMRSEEGMWRKENEGICLDDNQLDIA